jgi:hypothetical protein
VPQSGYFLSFVVNLFYFMGPKCEHAPWVSILHSPRVLLPTPPFAYPTARRVNLFSFVSCITEDITGLSDERKHAAICILLREPGRWREAAARTRQLNKRALLLLLPAALWDTCLPLHARSAWLSMFSC